MAETSVEPAGTGRGVQSGGREGGRQWICQVLHPLTCMCVWITTSSQRLSSHDTLSLISRVATPLAYFISGQLFAHRDMLTNLKTVPLHILTLPRLEEPSPSPHPPPHPPLLATAECALNTLLSTKTQSWILDVDLDFFSTSNPFRDDFSPVRTYSLQIFIFFIFFTGFQEECLFLENLYRCDEPVDESREVCDAKQIHSLNFAFPSCFLSLCMCGCVFFLPALALCVCQIYSVTPLILPFLLASSLSVCVALFSFSLLSHCVCVKFTPSLP